MLTSLVPGQYRPRAVDEELASMLASAGAVVVEGPRACGKTATATRAARSQVNLEREPDSRAAGLVDPRVLLEGERPRLIDEWQLVPEVWGQVRAAVDDAGGRPGQFILTGSAVPPDDPVRHSGAGRFLRLRMRPMTLSESGHSNGELSLLTLFEGDTARTSRSDLTIRDVADLVCRGGWPGLRDRATPDIQRVLRGYLDDTTETDLPRADGVHRDPRRVRRLLRSFARCTATYTSARAIAADMSGSDDQAIKVNTVLDYIAALERVFIVEDVPPWSPSLRSKSRLRGAEKRHLTDPSLAVAALGTGPDRLSREVDTLGLLFESMVIRDLRVYAQAMDATVLAYLDNTGLEADAIVETRDGRWAAFEVKLGQQQVDEGARALLRLAQRVDPERHGPPAVLGVITGWGFGYTRDDGVSVVPIAALGP